MRVYTCRYVHMYKCTDRYCSAIAGCVCFCWLVLSGGWCWKGTYICTRLSCTHIYICIHVHIYYIYIYNIYIYRHKFMSEPILHLMCSGCHVHISTYVFMYTCITYYIFTDTNSCLSPFSSVCVCDNCVHVQMYEVHTCIKCSCTQLSAHMYKVHIELHAFMKCTCTQLSAHMYEVHIEVHECMKCSCT